MNIEIGNSRGCPYDQSIGSSLNFVESNRTDVSFPVNTFRFTINSSTIYRIAVKGVFRYLQSTIDFKIIYIKNGNEDITGNCDVDKATKHVLS